MRRTKSPGDLTDLSGEPVSRPRGRRSELSNPQLHNRRDQLVQIFEGAWGEIGWELQRCKKADDFILIFNPLAGPGSWVRDVILIFCRPSSEPASAVALRKVRTERRALAEPFRTADEAKRRAEEQLQQVNWALAQAHRSLRRIVKRERKKRRKEAWKAEQQYRAISDKERRSGVRLQNLEASFARQELFRFLKSRRYTLTPLSLANAAAGLPYMGWRQSMRRSSKTSSIIANGLAYQVFKAIRYLAATARKKTENALVTDFRAGIPLLPSRYQLPKAELAEKWLYVERAIRQAYRAKPHPRALPFEITKQYLKQIQSQSQVDMVLAEQAKLGLSKQP